MLEQTKEIQGNTQAALHDQRQQMYRIEDGLDKVSAEATAALQQWPRCRQHTADAGMLGSWMVACCACIVHLIKAAVGTAVIHLLYSTSGLWFVHVVDICLYVCLLQIGQDLTYSERILRFMKMCCCCGFFCSACTEPAPSGSDKKWRGAG